MHRRDHNEPRPLYFGRENRPLFGWLHPCTAATLGLVVCNPIGDEAVRAHRSIRHLAVAACNAGVPALRFDYDGTGDSAGHDLEPDRVSRWLASIHAAAETLRRQSGVTHLCFLGIRLGATLAALAAAERTDMAGLVAIAPVVSGKAYVRELRLLQRAIDSKRNIVGSYAPGTLETAGFLFDEQTQGALAEVDLLRTAKRPAPRVLILDRAEMPAAEKWAQKLRTLDAQVDYSRVGGYPEMMLDNHESIVPEGIVAATTAWLGEVATGAASVESDTGTLAESGFMAKSATLAPSTVSDPAIEEPRHSPVEEHAVLFGDSNRLFGIVSVPKEKPAARAHCKAIILLNAGAVPHFGPARMHVTIARYLAQLGYTVLRMDIGNIGDSLPYPGCPESDEYPRFALQDLGSAIEHLQLRWGAQEVIAAGLCSGAYHTFKAAVAHYPLAQVIVINPLTFFWKTDISLQYPEYRVAEDIQRYRTTALSLAAWRKLVTGQVDVLNLARVLMRSARTRIYGPLRALARLCGHPLADDLATELRAVVAAAIDLQFVFSVGDPGLTLLRTQGGATARSLQARGRIGVTLIDGANHTFTDIASRRILLRVLIEKVRARGSQGGSRQVES
jgi:alpha/beta superfamily hydrolase